MNADEAVKIVLYESSDAEGFVVQSRCGKLPSLDRMQELHAALVVIFKHLRNADFIDRRLANALFGLSYYGESNVTNFDRYTDSVPAEFYDKSLVPLLLLVESIFENEWMLD